MKRSEPLTDFQRRAVMLLDPMALTWHDIKSMLRHPGMSLRDLRTCLRPLTHETPKLVATCISSHTLMYCLTDEGRRVARELRKEASHE